METKPFVKPIENKQPGIDIEPGSNKAIAAMLKKMKVIDPCNRTGKCYAYTKTVLSVIFEKINVI